MKAIIGTDPQIDFCPGGALAVADGDAVIEPINRMFEVFRCRVLTQDNHPPGHLSFASSHEAKRPYDLLQVAYGEQILWPDHCVQGSRGAEFHPDVAVERADVIIRKGFHREIDSYSAFFENDHKTSTGLAGYLRERGVTTVYIAGLAFDFCVGWSALDARKLGFDAVVVEEACRAIDVNDSAAKMARDLKEAGCRVCTVEEALRAARQA